MPKVSRGRDRMYFDIIWLCDKILINYSYIFNMIENALSTIKKSIRRGI